VNPVPAWQAGALTAQLSTTTATYVLIYHHTTAAVVLFIKNQGTFLHKENFHLKLVNTNLSPALRSTVTPANHSDLLISGVTWHL
jgi:hypothetical protein